MSSDYVIVGGGLAGCVLASRLKEYLPSASITLIEAGPDEHENPLLTEPMGTMQLHNSVHQFNFKTAPQEHYDGREVFHAGGKVLSGSSSVNYAAWTRGDRADYDLWAKLVDDSGWSYEGLLPYMRKTETHHDAQGDPEQHGFEGPIHTTSALSRTYPLTDKVRAAYTSIGIELIPDHNAGDNKGMAPHIENWRNGKRQPAGKAYGLKGVEVLTSTTVSRILLEDGDHGQKRAIGVQTGSGQIINTKKEVILSCGACRSPQILMISGIGPAAELKKHGIKQVVDAPEVGKNLHEHLAITQFYKIRDHEKGYCAPSALFNHPTYIEGFPTDYMIMQSADTEKLKTALRADGEKVDDNHPHLHPPRSHYEILPMYAPTEVPLTNYGLPFDGSIMSIGLINVLPTSRGSVTLRSADPSADPIIDPNYFATETDKVVLREALRRNMSAFETEAGKQVVEAEIPPPGYPPLTSTSTDEELDARIKRGAGSFFHSAGSVSMGRAVDTECRVKGVERLRVVDASIMPTPISGHYQVPVYALAERMADRIAAR